MSVYIYIIIYIDYRSYKSHCQSPSFWDTSIEVGENPPTGPQKNTNKVTLLLLENMWNHVKFKLKGQWIGIIGNEIRVANNKVHVCDGRCKNALCLMLMLYHFNAALFDKWHKFPYPTAKCPLIFLKSVVLHVVAISKTWTLKKHFKK